MNRQRGFSLIEAIVALAVFALLASIGIVVLRQALDSRAAAADQLDRLARLQLTDSLLRADLSQAALRPVRESDGQPGLHALVVATDGDARAWQGRAPLIALTRRGWSNPGGQARASLQHVQYRLVDGRLERSVRPHPDATTFTPAQVLLDGISELEVATFHSGRWDRGWPGGLDRLPDAIRLRYRLAGIGPIEQVLALSGEGR